MKVCIIGSGGREHAMCHSLKKSKNIKKIYCIPGNAGTDEIAENINIDINNFNVLKKFFLQNKVDYVIVGPEKPLVNGIVDFLEKHKIKVFGPNKNSSKLEGSKIFTKNLCKKYNIPTAKFGVFNNEKDSFKFLKNCKFPIVIKADGLASGKGVYICETKEQSKRAVKEIFVGKFGLAKKILLEEYLKGEEMSFFIISDGKNFKKFGSAQDHKRALEGDRGLNTGGMGAYSPSRLSNPNLDKKILNTIIKPTFKALKDMKVKYRGFLYAGLMIVKNKPYLIEYNVRMGDPECQTILPKLKTDFFEIIKACLTSKLNKINLKWKNKKSLCIVLCSKGYPQKYKDNIEIKSLTNLKLNKDEYIFHAGTISKNSKIFSSGGRVLNFVINSNNFKLSREKAIALIRKVKWKNSFFRKDIAYKVIK